MEFFYFLPKMTRLLLGFWQSTSNHSQPMLSFSRLFAANSDLVPEVFLRFGIICLTVVCTNAGS